MKAKVVRQSTLLVAFILTLTCFLILLSRLGSTHTFPRNSDGITYGSVFDIEQARSGDDLSSFINELPDLISAVASNGKRGYVRKEDAFPTLSEQDDGPKLGISTREIPVYLVDGKTVVGHL